MKITGIILLLISISLLITSNVLWYLFFITGGLLLLGSINKTSISLFNGKLRKYQFLLIYFLYALTGVVVESIRIYLQLWDYTGIFNGSLSVLFFVLIIYPIFFSFILEMYFFIKKYIKNIFIAFVISIVILIAWNEISNIFVKVWIINPENNILLVYALSFFGYIAEVIVAVGAYSLVSSYKKIKS